MPAKRKRFIVLCLTDRNGYGWDEYTLPPLLYLVENTSPDDRVLTHLGVVAFYLADPKARLRVEMACSAGKTLRRTDPRYATLGIGVAEGEMLAVFSWFGALKKNRMPIGETANVAAKNARDDREFQDQSKTLKLTGADGKCD